MISQGDKTRGQLVFNSQKAACFSCHAIGYRGGTIRADLTRIARFQRADLPRPWCFPARARTQLRADDDFHPLGPGL